MPSCCCKASDPLPSSSIQVDDLKAKLAIQEAELKQKNEDADKLIHVVGIETEKVSKEKAIADEEELKVQAINTVRRLGQHELCQHRGAVAVASTGHSCSPCPIPSPTQNVAEKQRACETDLAKAEPALIAAQEALNTLNKV